MRTLFVFTVVLILVLPIGCKDIYYPETNSDLNALAVQGLLTNHAGDAIVKVYQAAEFDSSSNNSPVKGLIVNIIDSQGNRFRLNEDTLGYYRNSDLYAEEGESYYLSIVTKEGYVYESDAQTLSTYYKQDSIYAQSLAKKTVETSPDGNLVGVTIDGLETYTNLSSGSTDIPKCKYDLKVTVLYTYTITGSGPPQTYYCWKTFDPTESINITEAKYDKTEGIIQKHILSFFNTDLSVYDDRDGIALAGWLLQFRRYNLSSATFEYYTKVKEQLEASGKLFDPIPSQLKGNIHCTNHSDKLIFGFFEVSNTENKYYKYIIKNGVKMEEKDQFTDFVLSGETVMPPAFW